MRFSDCSSAVCAADPVGLRLCLAKPGLGPCHFKTPNRLQRRQLLVMSQLFTGTATRGPGRIELSLVRRTIETRQGVALLEGLSLTERQLDNSPGQLTGKHRLIPRPKHPARLIRSEEHTSELQSLMRNSYAVFCLKKNTTSKQNTQID